MYDLPAVEFAFPGPLRDELVPLVLSGAKTTTTGLVVEYEHDNQPIPMAGLLQRMLDSAGLTIAVIETTAVEIVSLRNVSVEHARSEGEGHTTVAEWRLAHETFWHSADMRASLGDPDFTVTDDTQVVLERIRVVRPIRPEFDS